MKVVAFNGSPRANGNTYLSLKEVLSEVEKAGIETEIVHVGSKKIGGCTGCGGCYKLKNKTCVIDSDINPWIEKMVEADGILIGAPVYFSGINGTMKSFLERAFYTITNSGREHLRYKVGAAVTVARRSGTTATFDQLNKFLTYAEMFVVTSNYWNNTHGAASGEAEKDAEGLQTMRILGQNMAYLLKTMEKGKPGIPVPPIEKKAWTNFIR